MGYDTLSEEVHLLKQEKKVDKIQERMARNEERITKLTNEIIADLQVKGVMDVLFKNIPSPVRLHAVACFHLREGYRHGKLSDKQFKKHNITSNSHLSRELHYKMSAYHFEQAREATLAELLPVPDFLKKHIEEEPCQMDELKAFLEGLLREGMEGNSVTDGDHNGPSTDGEGSVPPDAA